MAKVGKNISGWIGVDLDGTLARYGDEPFSANHIGAPVPKMVERVKKWLAEGTPVRIVTARAVSNIIDFSTGEPVDMITPIEEWCEEHIGKVLPVTNQKDFGMIELWDDRAVRVEANTGRRIK